MAISEFVQYLHCQCCDQKGFEGRHKVEQEPYLDPFGNPHQATIWLWLCKYCGTLNKFIHTL